jgi:hypothetical protein
VLGRQDFGELVHPRFDQRLVVEHHAGAALRVGRGPGRLGGARRLHRSLKVGGGAEPHPRLHRALVGVEYLALAAVRRVAGAADKMIDVTQHKERPQR